MMILSATAPPARLRRFAVVVLAAVLTLFAAPAAAFAEDDRNLDQSLPKSMPIMHGQRVLTKGHVDLGPRIVDGKWQLLIHDDVAKADANAQSVWRYPGETVFQIPDKGQLTAPDDPAYRFLDAEPGNAVWVSPQTQNPDVVWVGWNTQDPDVMAAIDRGVTLNLKKVQGPGTMTVFLQSGSFGEPQLLWDSRVTEPQPLWVDVNTHTHANWAFTKPGIYLAQLEATANLIDGSTVADTQVIRFAVGTGTSTGDALAAKWDGKSAADTQQKDAKTDQATPGGQAPGTGPLVPILVAAIIVVAAALIAGFTAAILRGNRTKRRILAARHGGAADTDAHPSAEAEAATGGEDR